ncbi:hypothetical protein SCLCIDRAFT_145248, partial [Scleroderma citrinum Foug A]
SIITQGMLQLRENNQMEREMCQYLRRSSNVEGLVYIFLLFSFGESPPTICYYSLEVKCQSSDIEDV